jgi:hypothetical protein
MISPSSGSASPPPGAAHHPPRAVHGGEERLALHLCGLRVGGERALHDHRVVAHAPPDEPLLPGEGGGRALADHEELLVVVRLPPREVVVVVHQLGLGAAEDPDHLARHPFAAGVGVAPCQVHQREVVVPDRRVQWEQHLLLRHPLAPAATLPQREEPRRDGVTEAAAPEVHPHPDRPPLVGEDVHVVVPRADRAELRARLVTQGAALIRGDRFPRRVVEERVTDGGVVGAVLPPDPEAYLGGDLVGDPVQRPADVALVRAEVAEAQVGADRGVAAVVDDDARGKEAVRGIAGHDIVDRRGPGRCHALDRHPADLPVGLRRHGVSRQSARGTAVVVDRVVHETLRDAEPLRHVGDNGPPVRPGGLQQAGFLLGGISVSDVRRSLPGHAGCRRGTNPLLEGAAEPDLGEETELLLLPTQDLQHPGDPLATPWSALGRRGEEAEGAQHLGEELDPVRLRAALLELKVGDGAVGVHPRRHHLGAAEGREKMTAHPRGCVQEPGHRLPRPLLLPDRRAERGEQCVERDGEHGHVDLFPTALAPRATVDPRLEADLSDVGSEFRCVVVVEDVQRYALAVASQVPVPAGIAEDPQQGRKPGIARTQRQQPAPLQLVANRGRADLQRDLPVVMLVGHSDERSHRHRISGA